MNENNIHFYNVSELAKVLRVHKNTIYHAIRAGKIQAVRVGIGKRATLRICKTEVERMMAFDANLLIDNIVQNRVKSSLKKAAMEKRIDRKTQEMLDEIIASIEKERGPCDPQDNEKSG